MSFKYVVKNCCFDITDTPKWQGTDDSTVLKEKVKAEKGQKHWILAIFGQLRAQWIELMII